jgi:nucleoside-diphosphate-sugar epimerase
VRGLDLVPTPGLADALVGSITESELLRSALAGVEIVVHLAATPDDDDFFTRLLPNNLIGVYRVLEAARQAGVRRLILASSGQVVWHQRERGPWPIRADDPPTPRGWYAAGKVFLEAAGRTLADGHGIGVIVARLGWCPRTRDHTRELAATPWGPDVYLSPGDAGRFFACAVEAQCDIRYAVVYAMSRPVRQVLYDPGPARELLGFEPRDTWPDGLEEMVG